MACNYVLPASVQNSVMSVWISADNRYAFVELCSSDAANIALALNGINFLGSILIKYLPKTISEGLCM